MRSWLLLALFHVVWLGMPEIAGAQSGAGRTVPPAPGSCADFDFSGSRIVGTEQDIRLERSVFVREDRTAVFNQPEGGTQVAELRFNHIVDVMRLNRDKSRIEVRSSGGTNVGWVEARALQCQDTPLTVRGCQDGGGRGGELSCEVGIERKVVIRTKPARAGKSEPVTLYHTSSGPCGEGCGGLGRYEVLFVLGEREDRLLLSRHFQLFVPNEVLAGWVDKADVLEWNNSMGVRPAENLAGAPGTRETGGVWSLCGWERLDDAVARRGCPAEFLGGMDWYRQDRRLALLRFHQKGGREFLEVATPSVGYAEGHVRSGAAAPAPTTGSGGVTDPGRMRNFAGLDLSSFKNADVFFLIDGTRSMARVIEAIKGTKERPGLVEHVNTALEAKLLEGGSYRFGIRIFSDTTAQGFNGLEEGMGLPDADCRGYTDAAAQQNQRKFREVLATLRPKEIVAHGPLEDYAENVYGGILQALRDAGGCHERQKLFFVIGDNGYDIDKQVNERHRPRTGAGDIAKVVNDRFQQHASVIFIQMPFDKTIEKNKNDYLRAYECFEIQGRDIIDRLPGGSTEPPVNSDACFRLTEAERGRLLGKLRQRRSAASDRFIRLETRQIETEVLTKIAGSTQATFSPAVAREVEARVDGGQALVTAITELQKKYNTIPMVWWEMVKKEKCEELGARCTEDAFEDVKPTFIERSDAVAVDVWVPGKGMTDWLKLLHPLTRNLPSGDEGPRAFVQAMAEGVKNGTGVSFEDTGQDAVTYLIQRGRALPAFVKSPLLSYVPDQFLTKQVEYCEQRRLQRWVAVSHKRLSKIAETNGQSKPVLTVPADRTPRSADDCRLSPNGARVPDIDAHMVTFQNLGPGPEYSYLRVQYGFQFYWLPLEFLP